MVVMVYLIWFAFLVPPEGQPSKSIIIIHTRRTGDFLKPSGGGVVLEHPSFSRRTAVAVLQDAERGDVGGTLVVLLVTFQSDNGVRQLSDGCGATQLSQRS